MPLWLWLTLAPAALLGIALLVWAIRGDPARGRKRCPRCWYDMGGAVSLRCPECGRAARSERHLLRTRRRWRWAALGLLILIAAAAAPVAHIVSVRGWRGVPTPVVILVAPWQSLAATLPDGSDNAYALAFSLAIHQCLPEWQQRLLAHRLRACLRSPDPEQRGYAATYIQLSLIYGGNDLLESCAPELEAGVDDPDPETAFRMVLALEAARFNDPSLRPLWVRLLATHPNENVRAQAAVVLGVLGESGDRRVIVPLLRAILDPSEQVLHQVIFALARTRDPSVAPALALVARGGPVFMRHSACHALAQLEADAAPMTPAILTVLNGGGRARRWAADALGAIGPGAREAVPSLMKVYATTAPSDVASSAARALGRIAESTPELIGALLAGLDGPSPSMYAPCLEALYRLGWTPVAADRELVERLTRDNQAVTRLWARMVLARADGRLDAMVDELIGLLDDPDVELAETAIFALDSLGARSARALPALRAMCPPRTRRVTDAASQIRQQAAEPAIRHITRAVECGE